MQLTSTSTSETLRRVDHGHRINSIDFLRGAVMIIMALDHTRQYLHVAALADDPTNLQTTTPLLFMTRWITHFCAPVFVFLSGTSAFLQLKRKSVKELASFLFKRGLWLVFAEVVIITFGITFDISFSFVVLQVIWAIGVGMIILSGAVLLPFKAVLAVGLSIVLLHNLLDFYEAANPPPYPFLYSLIHHQTFYPVSKNFTVAIIYPFLPWTGLMLLGYCFGRLFDGGSARGKRRTFYLGVALVIAFILVRASNLYGDPRPWSGQNSVVMTSLSFINTTKYPPSLLFMCMTIGPALILIGMIRKLRGRVLEAVTIFGRVPFFYYVVHFYVLHLLTACLFLLRGHTLHEGLYAFPELPFRFLAPGEGYSLLTVYLIWIMLVLALYPLCRWFSQYKQSHHKWWLSYL